MTSPRFDIYKQSHNRLVNVTPSGYFHKPKWSAVSLPIGMKNEIS